VSSPPQRWCFTAEDLHSLHKMPVTRQTAVHLSLLMYLEPNRQTVVTNSVNVV